MHHGDKAEPRRVTGHDFRYAPVDEAVDNHRGAVRAGSEGFIQLRHGDGVRAWKRAVRLDDRQRAAPGAELLDDQTVVGGAPGLRVQAARNDYDQRHGPLCERAFVTG